LNDSKVEKCRLKFGNIEIFILDTLNPDTIQARVHPGKKFKEGSRQKLGNIEVQVLSVEPDGSRIIKLDRAVDDPSLDGYKLTPFPPYIKQNEQLPAYILLIHYSKKSKKNTTLPE
jgi:S-adenosylmethionine:tRNA-ribosyltransferase-isomerase (queuine synthetase)